MINSFDTGLNDGYFIQFVSGSCSKEIVLLTVKYQGFKYSNVLHIFTEDGQIQKTVKLHPSKGHYYERLFYNQVTKEIIGYTKDRGDGGVLIEYLSGQTAELQHSYLLHNTNFPESKVDDYRLVCHTSGTLGLVNNHHFISLGKPPQ